MAKQIKMYETSDEKVFRSEHEANAHEQAVNACKLLPFGILRDCGATSTQAYQLFFAYFKALPQRPAVLES